MMEWLVGWVVSVLLVSVFWVFAVDIYRAFQDRRPVSSQDYVEGSSGWHIRRVERHPVRVRLWWALRRAALAPRGSRRLMFRYSWDNSGPLYVKGWRRDP